MNILSIKTIVKLLLISIISITAIPTVYAQFNIREDFNKNSYNTDIVVGGHAVLTSGNGDPVNNGWLRLTPAETNKGGYAYINKSFPTNLGVYMEFEYTAWRTKNDNGYNGADGFSVFLFDASIEEFGLGAYGGSLGYANSNHTDHPSSGLKGGYLGVGLDSYGNFHTNSEGKNGPSGQNSSTLRPNSVTLRGPAPAYNFLKSTYTYNPKRLGADSHENGTNSIDFNRTNGGKSSGSYPNSRPNESTFYRKVKVYIEPIGTPSAPKYNIRVLWRTSPNGSDTPLVEYETTDVMPEKLKVGFAASTGAGFNFHEVRKLYATTTGGVRVHKQVDKPTASPDEELTYTITVNNETESTVQNLKLTDKFVGENGEPLILTNDIQITKITFDNKGNSSNTATGFTNGTAETTGFNNPFTTTMNLAPQSEATFTIVAKAKNSMMGQIVTNNVELDVTNIGITDPDLTNNISSAETTILNPDLDLKIEKSVDNNGKASTTGNTFTIIVTNISNAPKPAGAEQEITVTDIVPAGLTVTGYNAEGWTRTGSGNSFTLKRSDKLDAADSYPPIKISVTPQQNGGPWTNTAKLSYKVGSSNLNKESSAVLKWVNYWIGTTSTNWGTPTNWSVGVPDSGQDVEFATVDNNDGVEAKKDLYLDADRTIGSLINNSSKNLIITTDKKLVISGTIEDSNQSSGTIIIQSTANAPTGTLIFTNPTDNANVGATVQFYNKAYTCNDCGETNKMKWQYFGIPVQSGAFPYSSGNPETLFEWSEAAFGNKWIIPNATLTAFRGYEINNSVNTTPTNVYDFVGKLNVGSTSVDITATTGVNYSGRNLIGNSYTAAIPIVDGFSFDGSWNNNIYLFNTGSRNEWRKLTGATAYGVEGGRYLSVPTNTAGQANLPDRIPSMHAFMIDATTAGTLNIDYSKLTNNTLVNGVAWRSSNNKPTEMPYIVMEVIDNKSADKVWLFENMTTTRGYDSGWDGKKMPEMGMMQLYVSSDDEMQLQVATVPHLQGTTLGIKPEGGENFTVSFAVSAEVEARNLYLRDLITGRAYPIKDMTEYNVPGISTENAQRFRVVSIDNINLSKQDIGNSTIEIFTKDNQIGIVNNSDESCMATVYDVTGKAITKISVNESATQLVGSSDNVTAGIYVVKVTGKTINETKRVMLRK